MGVPQHNDLYAMTSAALRTMPTSDMRTMPVSDVRYFFGVQHGSDIELSNLNGRLTNNGFSRITERDMLPIPKVRFVVGAPVYSGGRTKYLFHRLNGDGHTNGNYNFPGIPIRQKAETAERDVALKLLRAGYSVDTEIAQREDMSYEVWVSAQSPTERPAAEFDRAVSGVLSRIARSTRSFPNRVVQPQTLDVVVVGGKSAQQASTLDLAAYFTAVSNSYQRRGIEATEALMRRYNPEQNLEVFVAVSDSLHRNGPEMTYAVIERYGIDKLPLIVNGVNGHLNSLVRPLIPFDYGGPEGSVTPVAAIKKRSKRRDIIKNHGRTQNHRHMQRTALFLGRNGQP